MTKDDNINIKLEVFKDKFSGKISIIAHFHNNAPNVYKQNEEFVWFPTTEEKNFLLEAFNLTSTNSNNVYKDKIAPQSEPIKEIKSTVGTVPTTEIKPKINIQHIDPQLSKKDTPLFEEQKVIPTTDQINQKEPTQSYSTSELDKIKKQEQTKADFIPKAQTKEKVPTVYDVPTDVKTYDSKKDLKLPVHYNKTNQVGVKKEETYVQTHNDKKDLDEAVISQADIEAIDAALKKRTEKDDYMVQADEKTIVDKVLDQKKKGKWNKT